MSQKKRQILGLILSLLVLVSFLSPQVQSYFDLPEQQKLSVGDQLNFFLKLPPLFLKNINVYVKEGERILTINGQLLPEGRFNLGEVNSPVLMKPGKVQLQLKLFNIIPLKKINVDVLPNIKLIPGGHSIGVLLRTEGVMVIGYSPILNEKNEPLFPAKDADILVGDIIVEVNGQYVITDDQVRDIVSECGQYNTPIEMTIKRKNKNLKRVITAHYCQDTKSYRIGLFIRDNAGGVGTLTFYEPNSKKFGALGHMITDVQTNQPIIIRQGKILCASVEDIQKAKKGIPGEKIGLFMENSDLGYIESNNSYGIYGKIDKEVINSLYPEALPIAYSNQIHTGKAQILTVIKGEEIKRFNIEIEKILYGRQDGKNMVIKINDQELLKYTGGIVQGMSGSPIIQENRIVGAVTHVFVNDPQRGYGVFIENMLYESGIFNKQQTLGLNFPGFVVFKIKKKKYL